MEYNCAERHQLIERLRFVPILDTQKAPIFQGAFPE